MFVAPNRDLPLLGIGEAIELYGLTARALRYYETLGLVSAQRDRWNRRCYDAVAGRRLEWIAQFRKIGLGLAEIEALLEEGDMRTLRSRALCRLEARLDEARAEVLRIETTLSALRSETLEGDRLGR